MKSWYDLDIHNASGCSEHLTVTINTWLNKKLHGLCFKKDYGDSNRELPKIDLYENGQKVSSFSEEEVIDFGVLRQLK